MGRISKLTDAQLKYAQRCERIIRKAQAKCGRAAVAHRLGISMSGLSKYLSGQTTTVEQGKARKDTKAAMPKDKRHQPIGYRGLREMHNNLDGYMRTSFTSSER